MLGETKRKNSTYTFGSNIRKRVTRLWIPDALPRIWIQAQMADDIGCSFESAQNVVRYIVAKHQQRSSSNLIDIVKYRRQIESHLEEFLRLQSRISKLKNSDVPAASSKWHRSCSLVIFGKYNEALLAIDFCVFPPFAPLSTRKLQGERRVEFELQKHWNRMDTLIKIVCSAVFRKQVTWSHWSCPLFCQNAITPQLVIRSWP